MRKVAETINFWVIPFYRDKIKLIIELARYKIQQDKNFPVSPAKVWKVAKHVLVNQVRRKSIRKVQKMKTHPIFR